MENWINFKRNLVLNGQNVAVDHWENTENIKSVNQHPQCEDMSFLIIESGVRQFVVSPLNHKAIKLLMEGKKESKC